MTDKWPNLFYILADRIPVAADPDTYARWMNANESLKVVGHEHLGNSFVSTVFLGLDHSLTRRGDPILFETMVFGGPLEGHQRRYRTYAEAEAGHAEMVAKVRKAQAEVDAIAETAGARKTEMTREEHIEWCKTRAREYLNRGALADAVASMMSDVSKHQACEINPSLAMVAMLAAQKNNHAAVAHFIEGFR